MLLCVLTINKDLKFVMWDIIPRDQWKNIFFRCIQSNSSSFIEIGVIKYISLVFQGIAYNFSPIGTMILSYFSLGERFKMSDVVFVLFSLFGVALTTIGIKDDKK